MINIKMTDEAKRLLKGEEGKLTVVLVGSIVINEEGNPDFLLNVFDYTLDAKEQDGVIRATLNSEEIK